MIKHHKVSATQIIKLLLFFIHGNIAGLGRDWYLQCDTTVLVQTPGRKPSIFWLLCPEVSWVFDQAAPASPPDMAPAD